MPQNDRRTARVRLRLFTALVMVLPVFVMGIGGARPAAAAPESIIYFPWIPNGETIGGQGPWVADLAFQNLSDTFCPVSIYPVRDGEWPVTPPAQITLGARESRAVSSQSLGVRSPGAPVRLEAQCEMMASLKTVTPDSAVAPWSDGARIVSGYTGLTRAELVTAEASTTSAWFLPIVQTNSDWNTFIRVANFNTSRALSVRVELYPQGNTAGSGGADVVLTRTVQSGETWTVNALETLNEPEWVGFARITADGDVGVIANRTKASTQMTLTNVGIAADGISSSGEYHLAAPLLFNAYNGWNTGINLANITDSPSAVTVTYFAADGGMAGEESLSIPARSMEYIYTPGNVQQEGFVGSAMIASDRPLVAAIDEVKYETTEGLSYMASGVAQNDAALPIVFREDPSRGRHDNSGINIINLSPDSEQTIAFEFFTLPGNELLEDPLTITIPAGSNSFVYLPFIDGIPPGTVASARLISENPDGFVAISNDINYAVSGDGSVVFVASSSRGYYHIPETLGQ
jgi:hypothetical protein